MPHLPGSCPSYSIASDLPVLSCKGLDSYKQAATTILGGQKTRIKLMNQFRKQGNQGKER